MTAFRKREAFLSLSNCIFYGNEWIYLSARNEEKHPGAEFEEPKEIVKNGWIDE